VSRAIAFCGGSLLEEQIRATVERAPRWVKSDLLKDGPERVRAEEALAAMIATALEPVVPEKG